MKTSVLTVISITDAKDKNGNDYRNIVVETPSVAMVETALGNVAVRVKPRRSSFNAWKESYLESNKKAPDFGYDFVVGDVLAGAIVTRKVLTAIRDSKDPKVIVRYEKTYTIENEGRPDTTTDEYSAVVLANSADGQGFESEVRKAFRRADHPLLDDSSITKLAILADPEEQEEEVPAV